MAYYGYKPAEQAIQIGDNTIVSADIADGSIVNADVNSSAAIAMSKTQLTAGTGITLSTNTLNVDAAQSQITSVGTLSSLTLGGDLSVPQKIIHVGDTDTYLSFGDDSLDIVTGGTTGQTIDHGVLYNYTDLVISEYLKHDGDTDTHLRFSAANNIEITAGGNKIMRFEGNAVELVVNEDSADIDFRVESNNIAHMLFVDGGNDKIGIGISAPENVLTIKQTENATESNITQDSDTWGVLVETGNYAADRFVGMIAHRNANKEAQTGIWSEITSSGSLMHLGTSADYDTGVNVKNMTLKHDGTVNFPGSITSVGTLHVGKDSSASSSVIEIGCGSGDYKLSVFNSSFSTNGAFVSDGATLDADDNLSGGLSIISRHASGQIRFYTGGYADGYKRLHIDDGGNVVMQTGKGLYFDGGSNTYITEGSGDTLNFYTGGNNTMTLNDHLLITGQLRVYESTQMGGRLYYTDSSNLLTLEANEVAGDNMRIKANNAIFMDDAGGTIMTIYDDKVGIGCTDPDGTFEVRNGQSQFRANGASSNPVIIQNTAGGSGDQVIVNFYRGASITGAIRTTDGATSYTSASDYRLKENEVAISDGITRLKQLKPYRFNFKNNPDKTVDGFFAHEVSSVVPEAASGEKDAVDENGDIEPQEIDQAKLVPLLVSALQEAIDRIEVLENA